MKKLVSVLLALVMLAMFTVSAFALSVKSSKVTGIHDGNSFYVTTSGTAFFGTTVTLDWQDFVYGGARCKATIYVKDMKSGKTTVVKYDSNKGKSRGDLIQIKLKGLKKKYKITVDVTYNNGSELGLKGYRTKDLTFTATRNNGATFSTR